MTDQIKQLMKLSQKLGETGDVNESFKAAQGADDMRSERDALEQRHKHPGGRIMFVCDVCGVFINSTDNEARRADHYNGKQYLGWKAIRNKLKDLENNFLSHKPHKHYVETTRKRSRSFSNKITSSKSKNTNYHGDKSSYFPYEHKSRNSVE